MLSYEYAQMSNLVAFGKTILIHPLSCDQLMAGAV